MMDGNLNHKFATARSMRSRSEPARCAGYASMVARCRRVQQEAALPPSALPALPEPVRVPTSLVDRARLNVLASSDVRVFLRGMAAGADHGGGAAGPCAGCLDSLPSPLQVPVKGDVRRFLGEKLALLRAESARRRNEARREAGDFERAGDGVRLLGEILADRPRPSPRCDTTSNKSDERESNMPDSAASEGSAALHAQAQLFSAQLLRAKFERAFPEAVTTG